MDDGRMAFAAVWPASTDATAVGTDAVASAGLTVSVLHGLYSYSPAASWTFVQ